MLKLPYDLAILVLGINPKELPVASPTDTSMKIHSSTIHNSQKGDATQTLINGAMHKQNVLHTVTPQTTQI